ncbi:hypothetical protein GGX14DRAFT_196017 [Mycena pura]|uniref:Uncharacterized protein n=1 Tax=Mycena pura TaxID=153505 RepID=A0AAD6Y8T6_9AGAR|nr:hypothetical protein GGX14DRAFT_196017 [Mycena pura]
MNFRNQTQLVLLAVVAVCVQMCSGANTGENGGMCKGHVGIPIPLTVCQAECKVVGNLPIMTCRSGLTCCLLVSCPHSLPPMYFMV